MKKLLSTLSILTLCVFLFSGEYAYIAKQDNLTVYLDITQLAQPPAQGAVFTLLEDGEELKNHKGESLGTIYKEGPQATVTKVEPKFAVAKLSAPYTAKPGQKLQQETAVAIYTPAVADAPVTVMPAQKITPAQAQGQKLLQTAPVDEKIRSAVMVNFNGKNILIGAGEKNTIKSFVLNGAELKEQGSYQLSPFKKIITLSAADIKGVDSPQIFAVINEENNQKIYTMVFDFDGTKITESATLRWAAKAVESGGQAALFGQEIYKHNDIKTTPVGQIVFEKNKFKYKKLKIRANSNATAFAFNYTDFDGDGGKDSIFTTEMGVIKLQLSKGTGTDFEAVNFATTPHRYEMGGQVRRVMLPLPAIKDAQGNTMIAAAANKSKLGIVADSFASYQSGALYFIGWSGTGLKEVKTIELDGVIYDLSRAVFNGYEGVLVTQSFETGATVFEIYR